MNTILNNHDRHGGNFLVTPNKIMLIDHNLWGDRYGGAARTPQYLNFANNSTHPADIMKPAHPEAQRWLAKLDPAELRSQMMRYGMDSNKIKWAIDRLKYLQRNASVMGLNSLLQQATAEYRDEDY